MQTHRDARERPLYLIVQLQNGDWRDETSRLWNAKAKYSMADVEVAPYEPWRPDLVTAHLCASDAIIERAADSELEEPAQAHELPRVVDAA